MTVGVELTFAGMATTLMTDVIWAPALTTVGVEERAAVAVLKLTAL